MDTKVKWGKRTVKEYLLDQFADAEKRRRRARSASGQARAIGAKQSLAQTHRDLFGTEIEESDHA